MRGWQQRHRAVRPPYATVRSFIKKTNEKPATRNINRSDYLYVKNLYRVVLKYKAISSLQSFELLPDLEENLRKLRSFYRHFQSIIDRFVIHIHNNNSIRA